MLQVDHIHIMTQVLTLNMLTNTIPYVTKQKFYIVIKQILDQDKNQGTKVKYINSYSDIDGNLNT